MKATMSERPVPELLAPAGNREALQAAVNHGADSVYLGLPRFSARARAENFSVDELPGITGELRPRGVRVYVAMNTLACDRELGEVRRAIAAVARAGVDALIVQDLGVAAIAREVCPELPLHASTQTSVGSADGAAILEQLGFERLIAPRELSIGQLAGLAASTRMQVEAFVHGAHCLSWSGQCLASLRWGGRSGNRGECAQPCRLPASVVVDGEVVRGPSHPLSPTDLHGGPRLEALCGSGVAALKIEGRLKRAEFVAAAVHHYRRLLDRYAAGEPLEATADEQADLLQPFSREVSLGHLDGPDHRTFVVHAPPGSRGLDAGQVVEVRGSGIEVRPSALALKPGDGVVFEEADGAPAAGGRLHGIEPAGRERVRLRLSREVDLTGVRPGQAVRRTDDPALNRRLRIGIEGRARDLGVRRKRVRARVQGAVGEPLELRLDDGDGNEVVVESASPLSVARTRPLDAERVGHELARMGQSPFQLDTMDYGVAMEVALPFAELKRMRRVACERLAGRRAAPPRRTVVDVAPDRRRSRPGDGVPSTPPGLSVLCRLTEQVTAAVEHGVVAVICEPWHGEDLAPMLAAARRGGALAVAALPRTIGEGDALSSLTCAPDGVLVRNLAGLRAARRVAARRVAARRVPGLVLLGDAALNAVNVRSFQVLLGQGLSTVAPGHDMAPADVRGLVEGGVSPDRIEVVVRAHVPLFHTAHCLFAARLTGAADRSGCGEICRRRDLAVRSGHGDLPVVADALCRNTVFEAHPHDGTCQRGLLEALGIRRLRVEFLREPGAEVRTRIAHFTA